jgi:hypothetical protein
MAVAREARPLTMVAAGCAQSHRTALHCEEGRVEGVEAAPQCGAARLRLARGARTHHITMRRREVGANVHWPAVDVDWVAGVHCLPAAGSNHDILLPYLSLSL